jgi:hypothetical protein
VKDSSIYGSCKFCGQMNSYPHDEHETQDQANECATLHCNCDKARHYTDRKQSLKRAEEQIENLFGDGASEYGLVAVKEEIKKLMIEAATFIYDGLLKDISINVNQCVKVKISKSTKGKLTFMRSDAAVFKQEV